MDEAQYASISDDLNLLENAVLTIIREIGDDPNREVRGSSTIIQHAKEVAV
jgi:hypothetical protein